jgi:transposase
VVLLGQACRLLSACASEEDRYLVYSKERILEILEAYDLTKSFRSAAALTGCDHHTVARYVAARAAGLDPLTGGERPGVSEPFVDKIHEWVDRSDGRIRADVVHEKLEAMGYPGSERTTRRVVAAVKEQWRRSSHRVYMPWITEPGLWLQWDYAAGPMLGGQRVVLFVAWLAWSRFRVVVPLRDRTMPSVIAALDATFRRLGGAPTFALTDNEKTVTDRHIAGIAVRNPQIVAVAHYYGLTIATCVPADPESKGGSESTVKLAKADLVPAEHNLLADYTSWEQLAAACDMFMSTVNGRVHRATGERPVDRLEIERSYLHAVPADPFTAAFGETRAVGWSSTLNHRGARYSVPHEWVDQRVWVRVEGDQLVVVATPAVGPTEIARHHLLGPGQASIDPSHYPPRRDPLQRAPTARTAAEAAFLRIGPGAAAWLIEAAGQGTRSIEHKMREVVELTKVFDRDAVDRALGHAATCCRFTTADLLSILSTPTPTTTQASETHSLQPGTAAWRHIGLTATGDDDRSQQ